MKTYVLTVSEFFPKTHNKSGLPTGFINAIGNQTKIHTIRGNYPLWKKRIEEIQNGNAVLSIRYWTGKPYNSKQKEVYALNKDSGIGIQELYFDLNRILEPFISLEDSKDRIKTYLSTHKIAKNDGLSFDDFKEWFKGYDLNEPMAIIHFTDFRY
jgi:hypothetical protein